MGFFGSIGNMLSKIPGVPSHIPGVPTPPGMGKPAGPAGPAAAAPLAAPAPTPGPTPGMAGGEFQMPASAMANLRTLANPATPELAGGPADVANPVGLTADASGPGAPVGLAAPMPMTTPSPLGAPRAMARPRGFGGGGGVRKFSRR